MAQNNHHHNNLSIDTKSQGANDIGDTIPGLVLSSTSTSTTFSDEPSPSVSTPKNQPIMTVEERESMAKQFVHDLGLNWDNQGIDAQNRGKRIMSPDYTWTPTKYDSENKAQRFKTTFRTEFDEFCENIGDDVRQLVLRGVFFEEDAIDGYLVIRRQKSGICTLHSGVVLQHYLLCHRSGHANHTMLDICEFMRVSLPKDKKILYIQTGTCGLGSEDFFLRITGVLVHRLDRISFCIKSEYPIHHNTDVEYFFDRFVSNNKLKEPGLVSCFKIEGAFRKQHVFDYEVDEDTLLEYATSQGKVQVEGKPVYAVHSMVMIGAWKDGTGKAWFLLQNFWRGGFFKLVSAEYMASCSPTICFAKCNDDVSLKEDYSTVDAHYAETAICVEECAPTIPPEDS